MPVDSGWQSSSPSTGWQHLVLTLRVASTSPVSFSKQSFLTACFEPNIHCCQREALAFNSYFSDNGWLTPAGRILNSAGDSWSRHTVFLQQRTLTVPVTLGSDALSFFWLTYTLNFHWLHHFLCSQTLYSCQLDVVIGCVIYSQTPSFCTDLETVASDRPCHCHCCTVLTLTVRLSYIHWLTVRS